MGDAPILSVDNLQTFFETEAGTVRAVDGVSFELRRGRTLGIVGESGSGKSVTALSILRLVPSPPGRIAAGVIELEGQNLLALGNEAMRRVRGRRIAMIFQDPMTSLNPYLRISRQLTEVLEEHEHCSRAEAGRRALEMLERVGIPDAARRFHHYPHEFSGGMRQRVMIAMALVCKPEVLIADEPTTALDVTIQAQILDLIRELRDDFGAAVILITHDLGVVAGMADDVVVMYAGKIVERARTTELFANPVHPYTLGLLASIPRLDRDQEKLTPIPGRPPDLTRLAPGCPFVPRCRFVLDRCREQYPSFAPVAPDHFCACWARTPPTAAASKG